MARRKKMDDEQMLLLAQQYYAEKCNDNIALLTIPKIGEYIRSKGHDDIEDYLIRRNEKIKNYINTLKEQKDAIAITTVSVFKDMDIDDFLKKNRTIPALKKALIERQNYYMKVAHSASLIFEENKELKKKLEKLEIEISSLEKELESSSTTNKETLSGFHVAKRRARFLQDLVETYVYPEIANELLVQNGILKKTENIVDPSIVNEKLVKPTNDVSKIKSNLIKGMFEAL